MTNTFSLRVLAAQRPFYEGECEYLSVPALLGQYGVLANHSNCVLALKPGEMHYRVPGEEAVYAWVSGGIIKIENNEVLVLVDTAEHPEEIDVNRAKAEEARAKEEILQKRSMREFKMAQATLARAASKLRVRNNFADINRRKSH